MEIRGVVTTRNRQPATAEAPRPRPAELPGDDAVAGVHHHHFAGHAARQVGEEEQAGMADLLLGDVAPERRTLGVLLQHVGEAANPTRRQGADRTGGDRVHADVARPELERELSHALLEDRLGAAHHVVGGDGPLGGEVGEGHDARAVLLEQWEHAMRHVEQRVGADLERELEALARRGDEQPFEILLLGEGDAMHQVVDRAPVGAEPLRDRVDLRILGDVALEQEHPRTAGHDFFDHALEALVGIGEAEIRPGLVQLVGDRPRKTAVVGHAHHQRSFSRQVDRHHASVSTANHVEHRAGPVRSRSSRVREHGIWFDPRTNPNAGERRRAIGPRDVRRVKRSTAPRKPAAAGRPRTLESVARAVVRCERCPRLREYCAAVARARRRAFRDEVYWGKPVPGFGDPLARLLIVGLAPGAHGANRTGRMFTGDSSGDWLYRALFEFGYASQASSTARDDDLELEDCYITAAARCAPPDNRPTPGELAHCLPYLEAELALLPRVRVVMTLGRVALDAWLRASGWWERLAARDRPPFEHGAETARSSIATRPAPVSQVVVGKCR